MKRKHIWKLWLLLTVFIMISGCDIPKGEESMQSEHDNEKSEVSQAPEKKPEYLKVRQQAEELLDQHKEKSVTYIPLSDPEGEFNLIEIKNIHMIEMLTGEYSQNQTKTSYGIGGTDLGISINKGNETFIFFGDTFKHETMADNWRSNTVAVTSDRDYTDGILFDRMITTSTGVAKELLRGKKIDNDEMTKIPTGGICIGDALYLSFMSVRHWGDPGEWSCNYGGIAKSIDNGETWEILESLQWPGDSQFCQMAPVVIGDMVYVPGISGGRNGAAKLMRVPVSEYENKEAYEYLTGYSDDSTPVFEKGADAMERASEFLQKPVGEMSFMYSAYLEEWIVTYICDGDIVLRTAKEIWGPYSNTVTIAAQEDFPGLYGAFMNENYVSEDGSKVCFLMSLWSPVYNVAVMEMELVRID